MKEQLITYTITVPQVEVKDYWKFSDFDPRGITSGVITRLTENAKAVQRFNRIALELSAFQTAIKSNNSSTSLKTLVTTDLTTLPGTQPASITFSFNVYRLEPFLDLWVSALGTSITSTASTSVYTDVEIKKAGVVIQNIVSTILKAAFTTTALIPRMVTGVTYPLDSPNNMTNSDKPMLVYQNISVDAIASPTVTVTAS